MAGGFCEMRIVVDTSASHDGRKDGTIGTGTNRHGEGGGPCHSEKVRSIERGKKCSEIHIDWPVIGPGTQPMGQAPTSKGLPAVHYYYCTLHRPSSSQEPSLSRLPDSGWPIPAALTGGGSGWVGVGRTVQARGTLRRRRGGWVSPRL
ncbi:hypothetical protein LY76DRAFT_55975 [Colletotrichum caudatum]|nr:hypothetical protein LY76DRAFT_55975 [Colletotrichum caudatum]